MTVEVIFLRTALSVTFIVAMMITIAMRVRCARSAESCCWHASCCRFCKLSFDFIDLDALSPLSVHELWKVRHTLVPTELEKVDFVLIFQSTIKLRRLFHQFLKIHNMKWHHISISYSGQLHRWPLRTFSLPIAYSLDVRYSTPTSLRRGTDGVDESLFWIHLLSPLHYGENKLGFFYLVTLKMKTLPAFYLDFHCCST